MKLSAIVIAKNEERVLERCLRSLAFCDEILLIDSGSTDRTHEIARACGARVVIEDWRGPATQRNRGLAQAQGEWRLLLDADEWVPASLRAEIEALVAREQPASAFRIPRRSSFCGQFMRHGGWWPDRVLRLIRRDGAHYEGGIVHETPVPTGPVGNLTQPLLHESYADLAQVLQKLNAYTTWGAQDRLAAGRSSSLSTALLHGGWAFVRTYVLRAGFLDGRLGLMLAIYNAECSYYKHVKTMLLARPARPLEPPLR